MGVKQENAQKAPRVKRVTSAERASAVITTTGLFWYRNQALLLSPLARVCLSNCLPGREEI